ncbi:hypothetical protein [Corynebacterium jeikeium]|uniref:hypothetical protein n=1 Tax=Corynebacterium jeikeium TaxID=38289 RepID=UPI00088D8D58|nr:hypothetical protein [Corynebacterium jeikeium]SCX06635.1 hypothetical protein CJBVI_0498 [Corynebacterium jeikeium]
MTRVQGNLKIVTGAADDVTEVWVRAARARPVTGGWLMTADDHHPVSGGVVDLELLPGACVLVAVTAGEPGEKVEMIVPESGTASLEACIRAAESAGDLERDALDELRRDFSAWIDEAQGAVSAAGESANAAKASADTAKTSETNAGKSASAAKASATAADESATAAASSRSDASSSANAARSSADAAKVSEANAGKSASAAKSSETSAKDSASAASNSASAAKTDADKANGSATTAQAKAGEAATSATTASDAASRASASESAAATSATNAAKSASAAKTSETNAGKSATTASTHATNAGKSASAAKADADRAENVIDNVDWHNDRLMVMGKISPPLTGPKGDKGEPGKSGASTWDTVSGKPSAFPPEPHKHTVADVTDLPESTPQVRNGAIVQRNSSGRASVNAPLDSLEIANKGYVDTTIKSEVRNAVQGKADKSYVDSKDAEAKALVGSRPAFFSGVGSPPSAIPGAVVGDYYLDETTMELHKITGV